ncbi:Flp family type IVb pilin [Nocardioides sp. HDW12B]|uniref:Flp family type IVb pilin n=1 Tax=Nocardioides sp. HDW12B TaxID=2714939 RepID=UPI00140D2B6D|nr:Flp family type IVb pilin [Nocardioides sp. HDW12B]QIK66072.1 Flp family type IVb pilin [Nocardioides sp. HDW12B]
MGHADRDERGASATEYGLLVVAIAAVVALIIFALGEQVVGLFQVSCDEITGQASTTASCN